MNVSDVKAIIGQAETSRDAEANINDFPYREALGMKINYLKRELCSELGAKIFDDSVNDHYEVSTNIAGLTDELQQSI